MKIIRLVPLCMIAVLSLSLISCKDSTEINPNNPPLAVFSYSPVIIDTSTIVTFTAIGSNDTEDLLNLLRFSWDFEGKQQWTEPLAVPIINYKYSKSGTYEVGLQVFDTEGWSGKTSSIIIVNDSI